MFSTKDVMGMYLVKGQMYFENNMMHSSQLPSFGAVKLYNILNSIQLSDVMMLSLGILSVVMNF